MASKSLSLSACVRVYHGGAGYVQSGSPKNDAPLSPSVRSPFAAPSRSVSVRQCRLCYEMVDAWWGGGTRTRHRAGGGVRGCRKRSVPSLVGRRTCADRFVSALPTGNGTSPPERSCHNPKQHF